MDDSQYYVSLLETNKKQEILLQEKQAELNTYISNNQYAIKNLKNTGKCIENKLAKHHQLNTKLCQSIEEFSKICQPIDLTWKEEKQKQKKLCETKTKMINAGENKQDKLKDVLKNVKQLEAEYQLEIITPKIEEYQNNTKDVIQKLGERHVVYKTLLKCADRSPDYQIPDEVDVYKSKVITESPTKIDQEIYRAKKNINNINAMIQELE